MSRTHHTPLAGARVWLTRPHARGADWAHVLQAAGAVLHRQPLLGIAPAGDARGQRAALRDAETADIVIVTSASAVEAVHALAVDWRPRGRLMAVGQATADALARLTGRGVEQPARSDSEGLLAVPALQDCAGRQVVLLTGEGGRGLLEDTLSARGACLCRIALYRREAISLAAAHLDVLVAATDILVITSGAGWRALNEACSASARGRLAGLSLVASSARVVQITDCDIDWRHRPTVIEVMDASGALAAVEAAWRARR